MLNTRTTLNISLILAVVVLATLLYFKPGVEPPEQAVPLTALKSEQVNRIEIIHSDEQPLSLVKEQQGWYIRAPVKVAANTIRVDSLLRLAQAATYARFVVNEQDLADFGLDHPLVVIRLNDIEIAFGGNEPLNNRRYVRIGSDISVIADTYFYQVSADPSSFVALDLLPHDVRLTRIVMPAFTIEQDKNGNWRAEGPGKDIPADAVDSLPDAWQRAQALRVSAYTKSDVAIGKVTVFTDNKQQRLEFEVLKTEPALILGRPDIGMRYHLSDEQARRLMLLPDDQNPEPDEETDDGSSGDD